MQHYLRDVWGHWSNSKDASGPFLSLLFLLAPAVITPLTFQTG